MSEHVSPFIPPLTTPRQSPGAGLSAPVIPDPPAGAPPAWGAGPQQPGGYPGYPASPYTGPGYIPNIQPMTPGAQPGAYLTPAAAYYPPFGPPTPGHHILPNGLSSDYTGYPPHLQPHTPHTAPPGMHPNTPFYGPASAPIHPMGGWGGPPRQPQHPPQWGGQQPHSAGPYGAFPNAFPQQPPPMWGGQTPAGPPMMNFDPWGMQTPAGPPSGPPPGWAQQMGMGPMGPPQGYQQQPRGPQHIPEYLHTGRSDAHVGDRVDPFMAGANYGPVLDPFLVRVVGAQPKLNPLLEPLPDTGADRPHLKWTMLFESNDCQRSTDPSHISWSAGRDEPATYPRVSYLNIVSETFPWMIEVLAHDTNIGVTCGEVIDTLAFDFQKLASKADFEALPQHKKVVVGEAYRLNRSRAPGVPGGRLKEGIRRLDYFGRDTVFGGIYQDERVVHRIIGAVPPCTFVLKCVRRYALTAEEIREHDARQREKEEQRRRREMEEEEDARDAERARAARRATVETVTTTSDEDD
ncbi:hypothetical protein FPV67DRAFT_293802 [Lyophyllum atratum]|nr:hypothetical protein FPV67DRAFT_293802 [Lyophyllum atratum]